MVGIVGLGNPGAEYEHTRHNVGKLIVQVFAEKHRLACAREKFKSVYGKGQVGSQEALVVLPETYMNLSGEPVSKWWQFYHWTGDEVIVVHDELDLPLGKLKFAFGRGAAGHNGIKSIIDAVGTQGFYRLRIGIGRPTAPQATADYVLGKFSKEEHALLRQVVDQACEALYSFVTAGAATAMQKYHTE